jgi:hypothetical protein
MSIARLLDRRITNNSPKEIPMITTSPLASTLEIPGGSLYYEVRGAGPLVVLVGAPMDARSFAPRSPRGFA